MIDPRVRPEALLRVGQLFAVNGDRPSATRAYREVLHCGNPAVEAMAKRCLDELNRPGALRSH